MTDETDFNVKYWHNSTKLVTVVNPRNEDYRFQAVIETGYSMETGKPMIEPRQYIVKAGGKERFPGPIANMYLDQMSKILAQEDKKIERMIDFALKAEYYDKLIVSVEDLLTQSHTYPQYEDAKEEFIEEKPKEEAFPAAKNTKLKV